ncbi:hypothetical protein HQK13_17010 [Blautia wexlerae]|uniref:Uncharacterized protein n=1 Tax=Blautia wexlerae TaxID=418240 RepID=A0A6L8XS69_9FIRM|nr:hypothetical protein [Blautia wexlerae]MCQ5298580.1 hypothetical protein [Blautia wexlerae]MZS88672.1 hypothetical protein [Blautia wexlerae]MZS92228.1 hypothetical protein [Blautia wexlerae]MZS98621.1 hypothetical protein [Blautia wexlerae]MZT01514.1 hypothetical protein [Blautia wexlerae]
MKYTKPTVKTATTNGVQPRGGCFIYSCSQPYKCSTSKGFSCTFFK